MSNFIKQWTQKEVEGLTRSFRRYSFYVIILKFVLPVVALVLAGVLFLYPAMTGGGKKIVLVAQNPADIVKPATQPVMTKPKFVGMDSRNQPYQISADHAVQERPEFARLEKITGDISLANGSWISGVAAKGSYDSLKHYIILEDDVSLFMVRPDDSTYQVATAHAEIDMDSGIMTGNQPVKISSDSGELTAEKFTVDRESAKITFQGNVKLVILKAK